jgi:hypothetical protein
MEKTYTETELYKRIMVETPAIMESLVGRLHDGTFFDPIGLKLTGIVKPDGTLQVTNIEAFDKWVADQMGFVLREFLSSLLVALLADHDSSA